MKRITLTKVFTQAIKDVSIHGRWGAFLLLECDSTLQGEGIVPVHNNKHRVSAAPAPSVPSVTKVLSDSLRSGDLYEHAGKGAFAVLLRHGKQPDTAVRMAQSLSRQLNGISSTERHFGGFPARIGIRIVAPESEPPHELIRQAHEEANRVTGAGNEAYRLYQNEGQTDFDISATQHDGGLL